MMPADWLAVIVLVLVALLSGYALGIWRGRTVGWRAGRRAAWSEWTRHTGYEPRPAILPPAQPHEVRPVTIDDIDFTSQIRREPNDAGNPW